MARPRKSPKTGLPTCVSQVEEALRLMDDFLSGRQIVDLTGLKPSQVSASLHHLQNKQVVEAVLVNNEPFWFLTGNDERQFVQDERAEHTKVRPAGGKHEHRGAGVFVAAKRKPLKQPKE